MRFVVLLHLIALTVAVTATPIDWPHDIAPSSDNRHDAPLPDSHADPPLEPRALAERGGAKSNAKAKSDPSNSPKKTPPNANRKGNANGKQSSRRTPVQTLIDAVNGFDMVTKVTMAKPAASGTNVLSCDQLAEAKVPPSLVFKAGSFNPTVDTDSWRIHNAKRLSRAKTLIAGGAAAKEQLQVREVSGEADLTQIMVHGLVIPLTEILGTLHPSTTKVHWYGVGKGDAPIPDLALHVDKKIRAVIEIKTTDSMPGHIVQGIVDGVPHLTMTMQDRPTEGTCTALAMKNPKRPELEPKRNKKVDILEQVRFLTTSDTPPMLTTKTAAEMFMTGATIGAVTNLESWIVLELDGDEIGVTRVEGSANDRSRALDIMLAISLKAMQVEEGTT